MNNEIFYILYGKVPAYTDRDAYISDCARSSVWGDDADLAITADLCGKIWDLAHLTIREIRAASGLTQAAFGKKFLISKRTVGSWEDGSRECPNYTRLLLAHYYGLDGGLI